MSENDSLPIENPLGDDVIALRIFLAEHGPIDLFRPWPVGIWADPNGGFDGLNYTCRAYPELAYLLYPDIGEKDTSSQ